MMSKSPYPRNCISPSQKKAFLEDKAIEMAESGNFDSASEIRHRLIELRFGAPVGEVIPEVAEGFNFTYRLDDMCKQHFRGDQRP